MLCLLCHNGLPKCPSAMKKKEVFFLARHLFELRRNASALQSKLE